MLTLCGLVMFLTSPVCGAEMQLLERYFDSLRARRLFSVAEEYATVRLAAKGLSPTDRAALSVELARTLVQHGMLTEAVQRTELWEESQRVLSEGIVAESTRGDRLRLEVWQSILAAQRSQLLAFLASLQPELESLRLQTVETLNGVITRLKRDSETLENTRRGEAGDLPADVRVQLKQQVDLLCGESLIWLVQLQGASDSQASLRDASRVVEQSDRSRSAPDVSRRIGILQARIARLQGDESKAEKLLERAGSDKASREVQDQAGAERIRLELSRNQVNVALQIVIDRLKAAGAPEDEFRAMAVETMLRAWKLAGLRNDAQAQQQLLTEARLQHEATGGIWRIQTANLLQRIQQELELGGELATIVRGAEAAWQSQQSQEALTQYGNAIKLAVQQNQKGRAFEFGLIRASILLQLHRWQDAIDELEAAISNDPRNVREPEADLLRCYALGQLSPGSDGYLQALQSHLKNYPDAATRADALWMLATDAERQQNWSLAIRSYQQMPAEHARKEEADLRLLIVLQQALNLSDINPDALAELEKDVTAQIRRIVPPLLGTAQSMTPQQCEILLQAVQCCMQLRTPLQAEADAILRRVSQRIALEKQNESVNRNGSPENWGKYERKTIQLQIISLASQNQLSEAQTLVRELGKTDPAALVSILTSLTDFTARLDADNLHQLGILQRMTVEELETQRSQMNAEQQLQLDRAGIQASLILKDWPAAIAATEDLLAKTPRDTALFRQLIDISMKQGRPADLKRAREAWLQLEKLETKGSAAWIEARVNIAELMLRDGDRAGAKKLLGVTRTLYPQLGRPDLKQRGDRLWQELQ